MSLGFLCVPVPRRGSQAVPACSRGSHLTLDSVVLTVAKTFLLHFNFISWFSVHTELPSKPCARCGGSAVAGELPGAFGVGNVELRGNRNLINCEASGKTKLFLLPSTALWPPGREPPWLQSKPRAGRGVLGPAEQGWGSLGTLPCCCVPCCPSLGGLTPKCVLGTLG